MFFLLNDKFVYTYVCTNYKLFPLPNLLILLMHVHFSSVFQDDRARLEYIYSKYLIVICLY